MTPGRVLAAVVVVGAMVLGTAPALASPVRSAGSSAPAPDTGEQAALDLLHAASWAAEELTYAGTQYIGTWDGLNTGAALVQVWHDPAQGTRLEGVGDGQPTSTGVLDPERVALLAGAYDLQVAGPGTCTGRAAQVVEARRADGVVAGRFWLDQQTGLLLRHEVYDETGDRVRSAAFVDLSVTGRATSQVAVPATTPDRDVVAALRGAGWQVPTGLPGGFTLLDGWLTTHDGEQVLHLTFSDGLSSLSLFAQPGRLGTAPLAGFQAETVAARPVWVQHAAAERVVWSGGGQVWTLVSDASAQRVRDAVAALPVDRAPQDGLGPRLARGMARLAGMLNPFD